MNISLWKRDADVLGVEGLFHLLVSIKIDIPVIVCAGPSPDGKIHAAVGQFGKKNFGSWVFSNAAVLFDDRFYYRAGLVDIIFIADAEGEVDTTATLGGIVDDIVP